MGTARLLAALKDAGPSPCEKYSCSRIPLCAAEKLACGAFERYVQFGIVTPPEIVASAEIFAACEKDHTEHADPKSYEKREDKVEEAIRCGVESMPELQKVWG